MICLGFFSKSSSKKKKILTKIATIIEKSIGLYLHQQNRKAIHRILARITDYIEVQSGMASRFEEFVNGGSVIYEVEHIWADDFERHQDEFQHRSDFAEHRNRIGCLLLLPRSFIGPSAPSHMRRNSNIILPEISWQGRCTPAAMI